MPGRTAGSLSGHQRLLRRTRRTFFTRQQSSCHFLVPWESRRIFLSTLPTLFSSFPSKVGSFTTLPALPWPCPSLRENLPLAATPTLDFMALLLCENCSEKRYQACKGSSVQKSSPALDAQDPSQTVTNRTVPVSSSEQT